MLLFWAPEPIFLAVGWLHDDGHFQKYVAGQCSKSLPAGRVHWREPRATKRLWESHFGGAVPLLRVELVTDEACPIDGDDVVALHVSVETERADSVP